MPSECIYCPCYRQSNTYEWGFAEDCKAMLRPLEMANRPEWCPLKPMPTEFTVEKLSEEEQDSTKMLTEMAIMKVYADGWNDCLKEIVDGND